jgi:hypothetical protein
MMRVHALRGAANRAGVIQRFGKGVERLHGNTLRESVNQAHLKGVVYRIRAGLIVIKAIGIWDLQGVLRVQRAGTQRSPIRSAEQIQVCSLGAGVGQIQNPILSERCLSAQGPNLCASVFVKWVNATLIGDGTAPRKTILQRENLRG